MGVDGFSMASVGMPKDITSAQAAATTEQQVFGAEEKVVNKIDRALNKRINNDEEKEHKNQYFEDGFQEDEKDEDDEDSELEDSEDEPEDSEDSSSKSGDRKQNVKKYKPYEIKDPENVIVRYNSVNDKVELYNKSTKKAVETIRPKDFVEMVAKLDYNSGILVNKKI
ncbi:MAG: hypothetical protein ACI37S_06625 [Candidatus Gastranaerophilaceae bacterium]